ncbi:ABC transporter ATP-binding protein [Litorihabitans aurantiacus]|uniref:Polyamine-transporting ATPase n=1 Tax=Litorihabitans aurantiacus TaxID=1930061 RepID=A0AA37XH11_9MICO|nr:ABC transporter ATP-binding protein [Litorihabitans aurantiacus]GMA33167.1 polyamine-transporting ATPase [Litorihabitans aurantiacus]
MTSGRVEVRDLRLGYDGELVLSLDELTVEPGEFVSVLGPSGCGKSTLLSALAGFVDPMAGTVAIDGEDVTHVPAHRRETGMVFQSYALFPHLTVRRNLEYGLRVRKVGKAERAERVGEILDLVGLEEFADRYPRQLSGGQQQRVAIGRSLVTRPRVLLLDEPLSNLDAKLRRYMRHELRELQQRVGTTMIFVTHDQAEALATSDRVVLLADGRLEQLGTPEELYRAPRTAFVADFVGAANVLEVAHGTHDGGASDGGASDGGASVLGRPVTGRAAQGTRVAIRPEALRLAPATAADPEAARAVVVSVGFTGERYDYRLRTSAGVALLASPPAERDGGAHPAGTAVAVAFDAEDVLPLAGTGAGEVGGADGGVAPEGGTGVDVGEAP